MKIITEEDFEEFLEDLTPNDFEENTYIDVGTIKRGFIKIYLTFDDCDDENIDIIAKLSTEEYGDWVCKGYKHYSKGKYTNTTWDDNWVKDE